MFSQHRWQTKALKRESLGKTWHSCRLLINNTYGLGFRSFINTQHYYWCFFFSSTLKNSADLLPWLCEVVVLSDLTWTCANRPTAVLIIWVRLCSILIGALKYMPFQFSPSYFKPVRRARNKYGNLFCEISENVPILAEYIVFMLSPIIHEDWRRSWLWK